jgi:hypothetical protein
VLLHSIKSTLLMGTKLHNLCLYEYSIAPYLAQVKCLVQVV